MHITGSRICRHKSFTINCPMSRFMIYAEKRPFAEQEETLYHSQSRCKSNYVTISRFTGKKGHSWITKKVILRIVEKKTKKLKKINKYVNFDLKKFGS